MRVGAALAALLVTLAPLPARSDVPPPSRSPYGVRWAIDVPVLVLATAGWAGPQLFLRELITPSCPCRGEDVDPIDRLAVGLRSAPAATASDLLLAAATTAPFALDAIDVGRGGGPWGDFVIDALVLGQTLAVNGALSQAIKVAVHRPRPLLYDRPAGDPAIAQARNYVSFYSGHTAGTFAAGIAYATTFSLRHPSSRYRRWVYGAAFAAGGTVGLLRVVSGNHFPSDVAVGAVAGSVIGYLVPRLHRRAAGPTALVAPAPGGAVLLVSTALD